MYPYLTINGFGRLRNVNANSLRYYERLGILCPAYTDPNTSYRYYLPEQLFTLDTILLCLDLGIPLKQLPRYMSGDALSRRALLEDGRAIAERRMAEIQTRIQKIEYTMQRQEEDLLYEGQSDLYARQFPARTYVLRPYAGSLADLSAVESLSTRLLAEGEENGLTPVLTTCLVLQFQEEGIRRYIAFEVLTPGEDSGSVIHVPGGTFQCLQISRNEKIDLLSKIQTDLPLEPPCTVIVSDLVLAEYHGPDRYLEIQAGPSAPMA